MAETPVNPFQIGGADVAGMGTDTRHRLIPGKLTALREARFPGSRSRFSVKGRALYPTLVVTGPLRAPDFATLYGYITQHQDAAGTVGLVAVTIQGQTFDYCDWVEFSLTRPEPVAYRDADGDGVRVDALFRFYQTLANSS